MFDVQDDVLNKILAAWLTTQYMQIHDNLSRDGVKDTYRDFKDLVERRF